MDRKALLSLFALAALVLVAGGGGEASLSSDERITETISVTMNDVYFGENNDNAANPPVWTATSGAEVTLDLDNRGAL